MKWKPCKNGCENVRFSEDRQFMKLKVEIYVEGLAEKVIVSERAPTQTPLTSEQEALLQQVPKDIWSQHKTDVGSIKSAQPVRINLKTNIRLPFQRQYPLKQHAAEGIRPTIRGLLKAGVLR